MAGVTEPLPVPTERGQLAALLEMRWRLFARNMKRDDERTGFILWLLGRIAVACFSLGAGSFACGAAYLTVAAGRSPGAVFHPVFLGWQLLNLLRGSIPHGVEAQLLRFPLRFRTYVLLWLSAGALEGITLVGTWVCLGLFVGLVLAGLGVWRSASSVLLFYLLNLLLTRTVFVWLGRMLARRRVREAVLIVMSVLSLLPQMLRLHQGSVSAWAGRIASVPWLNRTLHWNPGSLASAAVTGGRVRELAALAGWCSVVAGIFLMGLSRSFHGDDVYEFQASPAPTKSKRTARRFVQNRSLVLAVAEVEWARLRHEGSAIFATIAPLLYVVLFGLRLGRGPFAAWTIPAAAAYISLTLRSMNVFGKEGAGVQLYLLSPVPLRTVLLGKNLFAALLYTVQVGLATLILSIISRRLSPAAVLFTALWMVFYVSVAFAVGNRRSVRSPRFVPTNKVSLQRAGRSYSVAGGGWIGLLTIFGSTGLCAAILGLCAWIQHPWLAPWMMLPFTVAGALLYWRTLQDEVFGTNSIVATEALLLRVARRA